MSDVDTPDRTSPPPPVFDYNRPRRKSRSMHHRMQRRALKRRLAKFAFLAVIVALSILAAYLVAG